MRVPPPAPFPHAEVAQPVERQVEALRVGRATRSLGTTLPCRSTVGRPVVTRGMEVRVLPRQPSRSSSVAQSATVPWSRPRVQLPPASPSASWAPASPAGCNPVARAVQVQLLRRGPCSASSDGQSAGTTRRRPAVRIRRRAPTPCRPAARMPGSQLGDTGASPVKATKSSGRGAEEARVRRKHEVGGPNPPVLTNDTYAVELRQRGGLQHRLPEVRLLPTVPVNT